MDWAKGRLALICAATIAFAAFVTTPLLACDSRGGCPSNMSNLDGVAANALPTYPEPAAEASAAEPMKLKKFTRQRTRTARRAQPRKASLAQRAQAGKHASVRKAADDEDTSARTKSERKVASALVNANAALVDTVTARSPPVGPVAQAEKAAPVENASPFDKAPVADATGQVQAVPTTAQVAAVQPPTVPLVSADEFNELDQVAWEANQMPKLMQLTDSNSRAELRDDDSRWAHTSMIGKLFVAFGALLTLASAIRMFMA